ncbi:MAG: hypothetical protein M0R17_10940, partial [Candidatus Omnitrophica bacterium]|nr:hypothetical protein [Candidatus Omnitrophota bacterium]
LSDTSSNRMKPADTYNKITKEKKEGFIHWLGNTKVKSQIELDFKFSFYFIMILLCFLSIIWLTIKGVQIIIK